MRSEEGGCGEDGPAPLRSGRGGFSPFRALRHRNFRLWFGGQLTSLVGTWMQAIAQSWLVYRTLGGTARDLGLVSFAGAVPLVPLALVSGAVADRFPRRWIIFWTQAAMMILAFILAYLCATEQVRLNHVLVLATLLGAAQAIDAPARQSFVAELSCREDLANAIALNSATFHGACLIGPAAAGILVAAAGIPAAFLVNGISYLAALGGLLLMDRSALPSPGDRREKDGGLLEGVRYIRGDGSGRGLFLLVSSFALLVMPYHVLVPIYAAEVYGGGARNYGMLMAAAGGGAVGGAVVAATDYAAARKERFLLAGTAAAPLCLMAFSFCRVWWLALALLPLLGFAIVLHAALANAVVQGAVPDRIRGRVMAVYVSIVLGMMSAGGLLLGTLASSYTAPRALFVAGAVNLAVSAFVCRRYPELLSSALSDTRRPGGVPAFRSSPS
jgi:MFS family permease